MKRFAVALGILATVFSVAVYSTFEIADIVDDLENQLDIIRTTPQEDRETLLIASDNLHRSWEEYEDRMVLFVNKDALDTISLQITEIPALVEYGEYSFLYSKVDSTSELLDDMWKATMPGYRTLL